MENLPKKTGKKFAKYLKEANNVPIVRDIRFKLQPKESEDDPLKLPYPFFINKLGLVGRQDFWRGKPFCLVGFNPKLKTGVIKGTITFEDFLKEPKRAEGMYPIFEHADGSYHTYGYVIKKVSKV